MSVLALIPARGGSKRIPRKNIKKFLGVAMLERTIETLKNSNVFDTIIVSTDDAEIAQVAKGIGAEVPFFRPENLADDYTPTLDVVKHGLEALGGDFDAVCCVYPTSPFLKESDLGASKALLSTTENYVFSASKLTYPFQRSFKLLTDNYVEMFYPEYFNVRSQDLDEAYHDAGQFYWGRKKTFLDKKPIFTSFSKAYLMPSYRVQDIDTEEDWVRAEMMYEVWKRMGFPD